MFADDTTLYFDYCNQVFLDTLIKNELLNINKWFISNRLRRKYPITDTLLIPTLSRISVTIRDIKKLYIHELLVI